LASILYDKLIADLGSELHILLNVPIRNAENSRRFPCFWSSESCAEKAGNLYGRVWRAVRYRKDFQWIWKKGFSI